MRFSPTIVHGLRYIIILIVLRPDRNLRMFFREDDGEGDDEFDACLEASQAEQLKLEMKNLLYTSIERQPRVSPHPTNLRRSSRHIINNSS